MCCAKINHWACLYIIAFFWFWDTQFDGMGNCTRWWINIVYCIKKKLLPAIFVVALLCIFDDWYFFLFSSKGASCAHSYILLINIHDYIAYILSRVCLKAGDLILSWPILHFFLFLYIFVVFLFWGGANRYIEWYYYFVCIYMSLFSCILSTVYGCFLFVNFWYFFVCRLLSSQKNDTMKFFFCYLLNLLT